jgi:hypothetical protein
MRCLCLPMVPRTLERGPAEGGTATGIGKRKSACAHAEGACGAPQRLLRVFSRTAGCEPRCLPTRDRGVHRSIGMWEKHVSEMPEPDERRGAWGTSRRDSAN